MSDLRPPSAVQRAAALGVRLLAEGHGGRGLVPETVRWARALSRGEPASEQKVRAMRAWFRCHGASPQEVEARLRDPHSPARVAWLLWGGDPGRAWAEALVASWERAVRANPAPRHRVLLEALQAYRGGRREALQHVAGELVAAVEGPLAPLLRPPRLASVVWHCSTGHTPSELASWLDLPASGLPLRGCREGVELRPEVPLLRWHLSRTEASRARSGEPGGYTVSLCAPLDQGGFFRGGRPWEGASGVLSTGPVKGVRLCWSRVDAPKEVGRPEVPQVVRQNPLLMDPPRGIHGLGVAQGRYFKSVLGRRPTREDYLGVHTTGSLALAAVYAQGACEALGSSFAAGEDYPVVVELDVSGLAEKADVDAMVKGAELFGDPGLRREVLEHLEAGKEPWEVRESLDYDAPQEADEDVFAVVESQTRLDNPIAAIEEAHPEDFEEALWRWARDGEVSEEAITQLIDQRRYLTDIGLDRVVRVLAVKPLWRTVVPLTWDDEDSEEREEVTRLEEAGWSVVTLDDVDNLSVETWELWSNPEPRAEGARLQFHGSASSLLSLAFPTLPLPQEGPFPVTEEE